MDAGWKGDPSHALLEVLDPNRIRKSNMKVISAISYNLSLFVFDFIFAFTN
jgi:ATP-dependent Lon protease